MSSIPSARSWFSASDDEGGSRSPVLIDCDGKFESRFRVHKTESSGRQAIGDGQRRRQAGQRRAAVGWAEKYHRRAGRWQQSLRRTALTKEASGAVCGRA